MSPSQELQANHHTTLWQQQSRIPEFYTEVVDKSVVKTKLPYLNEQIHQTV